MKPRPVSSARATADVRREAASARLSSVRHDVVFVEEAVDVPGSQPHELFLCVPGKHWVVVVGGQEGGAARLHILGQLVGGLAMVEDAGGAVRRPAFSPEYDNKLLLR